MKRTLTLVKEYLKTKENKEYSLNHNYKTILISIWYERNIGFVIYIYIYIYIYIKL